MSDAWYTEQLARARQYRYCAGKRLPRRRKFVNGAPQPAPVATEAQRRDKVNGATRAAAERDAERKRQVMEAARAFQF